MLNLLKCKICEYDGETPRKQLHSFCMDGTNQGFIKKGSRPFLNISEPCAPFKPSTFITKGRAESGMRPLTTRIREEKPVPLGAIRGRHVTCTKSVEKDFAAASRPISDSSLPTAFCSSSSICGRNRGDLFNDVGLQSILTNHRKGFYTWLCT